MENTNRKCIFGNDLLLETQSNVGFPAAVAVGFFGHKLNVPYNCSFIHNVIPSLHISQGFVKSLCSFLS